jgi:hypothetical protein
MENSYHLIDQAHNVFFECKEKDLWTNLEIIDNFNILHSFNSSEYPILPTDYETIFLIYSHLYQDDKVNS